MLLTSSNPVLATYKVRRDNHTPSPSGPNEMRALEVMMQGIFSEWEMVPQNVV